MAAQVKAKGRALEVLLVEDDPGDIALLKSVLKDAGFPIRIHLAWNGVEALNFLTRKGDQPRTLRPDVILLDLEMPRKGGLEVLSEIKQDPELQKIPVFVLTGSHRDTDVFMSFYFKAEHYIVKPMDVARFGVLLKYLQNTWIKIAESASVEP